MWFLKVGMSATVPGIQLTFRNEFLQAGSRCPGCKQFFPRHELPDLQIELQKP